MIPNISIIVAKADNNIIGYQGHMPWHISSDLKNFRHLTFSKPLLMGRKTFEALGRPLEGRDNIVVSRNPNYWAHGIDVARDVEHGLAIAETYAHERMVEEVMVIGGAEIYRSLLPRATRIYLTEVHSQPEGDIFFPSLDLSEWHEMLRKHHPAGQKDDHDFSFVILDRLKA